MKLWQALAQDPQNAAVLLTPDGADAFIRSFPLAQQRAVAEAAPKALDSEVADGMTAETALSVFANLVAADLTAQGLAVMTQEPTEKPVLPS